MLEVALLPVVLVLYTPPFSFVHPIHLTLDPLKPKNSQCAFHKIHKYTNILRQRNAHHCLPERPLLLLVLDQPKHAETLRPVSCFLAAVDCPHVHCSEHTVGQILCVYVCVYTVVNTRLARSCVC